MGLKTEEMTSGAATLCISLGPSPTLPESLATLNSAQTTGKMVDAMGMAVCGLLGKP